MTLYQDLQERLDGVSTYQGYFMALCPFHDDHSPSFMVHDDGKYYCKTCHASGTLEYLERYLGKRFDPTRPRVIVESKPIVLPKWKLWEKQWGTLEGIARAGHDVAMRYDGMRMWFANRGLLPYMQKGMFGWLDGWSLMPVMNAEREVVEIVVHGQGSVRYAIRGTQETLYCPDWERLALADTIYIVYGMVDSWAMHDCGLPVITGITGKALNADLVYALHKKSIIVPDYMEYEDAWKLKLKLGMDAEVMELDYPFGTKDPDNVWRKLGKATLLSMLGVDNG